MILPHMILCSRCPTDTFPLIADLSNYVDVLGGRTTVEKSTVAYLEGMDKITDKKKEVMLDIITTFQLNLKVGEAVSHLIVTGDAKRYCTYRLSSKIMETRCLGCCPSYR